MSNNIGLIIWGCKGGHKVFCSNGVVDYKQEIYSNTIKDIRSFVRFNLTKLTTYAIEFTDRYKVFTIYRSCNDSGTGGYVAITVYIPHELRVVNLRTSLDLMMDYYFKEYVHPTLGTYYDGKYDDIELFAHYIEEFQSFKDKPFKYSSSIQDDKPHLKLYENINEVDAFFESPYRKEFFKCQEVMFMSKELYNKRPETLRFNFEEKIIENVTDPEKLPQLAIGDNMAVVGLKINGEKVDVSSRHPINASTTTVEITLRRKYCSDSYITGNVAALVEEGKLQEKEGVIMLGSKLPMCEYQTFTLNFTVNGKQVPDGLLYIQEANTGNPAVPIKDSKFDISGEKLNNDFMVGLRPYPDKSNKIIRVHTFKPHKNVDDQSRVNIVIESFEFTINYDTKIFENFIYVYLPKVDVKIAVPHKTGETICIFLPPGTNTSSPSFDTEKGETEWDWDKKSKILYLSPKVLEYELQIPEHIRPMIKSWDFKIFGKSKKKSQMLFSNGSTFKIKLDSHDNLNDGKLVINGESYDFNVDDHLRRVTPFLIYVKLQSGDFYTYAHYAIKETITTKEDRIFPYKKGSEADVIIHKNEYNKSIERSENPVITITLEKKVHSSYKIDEQNESGGIKEDSKIPKLTFVNCDKFHLMKGRDRILIHNSFSPNFTSSKIIIYDRKGREMCTIYRDESIYTTDLRKQDEEKGFFISYNEYECHVEYKEKEFHFKKYMSLRWILSIVAIVLIGLSVKPLWNLIFAPSLPIVMNIQVTISDKPEFLGETIDGIKGFDDTKLINVKKEDSIYFLQILWDKDSASNNKYASLLNRIIHAKVGDNDITFSLQEYNPNIEKSILNFSGKVDENSAITEKIELRSPLLTTIEKVSSSDSTITYIFNEYFKILETTKNENAVRYILTDAQKKLRNDTTDYNLFLKTFETWGENQVYCKVQKTSEEMKKKIREMQNQQEVANKLIADAIKNKNRLRSDECTKKTLDNIGAWWKALDDEKKQTIRGNSQIGYYFDNAIRAYSIFFTTKKKDDMNELLNNNNYKICFGTKQVKIIEKYAKSSESFTRMRTDLEGNKLKEAIELYGE